MGEEGRTQCVGKDAQHWETCVAQVRPVRTRGTMAPATARPPLLFVLLLTVVSAQRKGKHPHTFLWAQTPKSYSVSVSSVDLLVCIPQVCGL